MSNPYIIIPKGADYYISTTHLTVEPFVTEYHVNIHKNLNYVRCNFGGWYNNNGELVFIANCITTLVDSTQLARDLFKPFGKYLCRRFLTIEDWTGWQWKVGPEALKLLRAGTRFITDYEPKEENRSHDLVLPPNLQ